jgi:hypothetical protein
MLIATFNFRPSLHAYFTKGKLGFQDIATQDAPNSDRVAIKPYLHLFEGGALSEIKYITFPHSNPADLWDKMSQSTPLC